MTWLNNDICWCADSAPDLKEKQCKNTECFRHLANLIIENNKNIFTCSSLKDTAYCPIKKGENNVSKEF